MADHPRHGASPPEIPESAVESSAAIEQLLLSGLDHYFAGRYDQAIHVWTRVLFLDRGHVRARSYLERARQAQAESQRRSDELLQGGVEAFTDGQPARARRLLTSVLHERAGDEVAAALLDRLERLEAAGGATRRPWRESLPASVLAPGDDHRPRRRDARWPQILLTVVSAGLLAMAAYMVTVGDEVASWVFTQRDAIQGTVVVQPRQALPTPDVSSRFVERARLLYGRGRVDEALRELDQVRHDDQARPDADRLRAELQRVLLAGSPGHARRPPSSAGAIVR